MDEADAATWAAPAGGRGLECCVPGRLALRVDYFGKAPPSRPPTRFVTGASRLVAPAVPPLELPLRPPAAVLVPLTPGVVIVVITPPGLAATPAPVVPAGDVSEPASVPTGPFVSAPVRLPVNPPPGVVTVPVRLAPSGVSELTRVVTGASRPPVPVPLVPPALPGEPSRFVTGASGPLPPVPLEPVAPPLPPSDPSRPVIGARGLPLVPLVPPEPLLELPVLPPSRPPTLVTVLPSCVTTLPRSAPAGLVVAPPICAPAVPRPVPTVVSRLPTGVPRPVVAPTFCVVPGVWTPPVSVFVIGLMRLPTCVSSCWIGVVFSVVLRPDAVVLMTLPTVPTRPPTVDVTGASGDSGPAPRLVTALPTLLTAALAPLSRPVVDVSVGPSGFCDTPIEPRPAATPLPSDWTPLPRLVTALPTLVAAGLFDMLPTWVPPLATVVPSDVTRLPVC